MSDPEFHEPENGPGESRAPLAAASAESQSAAPRETSPEPPAAESLPEATLWPVPSASRADDVDLASDGSDEESVSRPVVRPSGRPPTASGPLYWLTFLMTVLGLTLVAVTVVPHLLEEGQYRMERGRQRAQLEIAQAHLSTMPLQGLSNVFQLVSQRVGPSVVHINVTESAPVAGNLPSRVPVGNPRLLTGQGSGVIVDAEGFIVTNRHVIDSARTIDVSLSDGRRMVARVVGVDKATDLAVLKIDAQGLVPAEWANSNDIEVGSMVWAVGSPFGLERSITFGILSAKHRAGLAGSPLQDLMQTDAAVNPGNSGGPLVDTQGRVIGINTAIVGPSYSGVSFAIPSSVAKRVYEDLRTQGQVARGWFGVEMAVVPPEMLSELKWTEPRGVLVRGLTDERLGESPARVAGILPGDIVMRWGDQPVATPPALVARVAETRIGETVPVRIYRAGQELDVDVTVGQRPQLAD